MRKIKPLNWDRHPIFDHQSRANTAFGYFTISARKDGTFSWFGYGVVPPVMCNSLEEAKDSCFAYYSELIESLFEDD